MDNEKIREEQLDKSLEKFKEASEWKKQAQSLITKTVGEENEYWNADKLRIKYKY
jgi:hypothetical protein